MIYFHINNKDTLELRNKGLPSVSSPSNLLPTDEELQKIHQATLLSIRSSPKEIYDKLVTYTSYIVHCDTCSYFNITSPTNSDNFYSLSISRTVSLFLSQITNIFLERNEEYVVRYNVWLEKKKTTRFMSV